MNQKGFIQIPILIAIIVGVLVLIGTSYFGVKQYQNYQIQKVKEIEFAKQNQEQKNRDTEIEKLKNEVESLKNLKPQTIIKEVPKEVTKSGPDLSIIISQWRSSVAYVECNWPYVNSQGYFTKSGSGLFWNAGENNYFILSNLHVVTEETAGLPQYCTVQIPGDNNVATIPGKDIYKVSKEGQKSIDASLITIKNPTLYMINSSVTDWPYMGCLGSKNDASVGDQVVILGYPGIGSQTDITATEGIVSGFEGDYYITSAKVEHGNSGGAAILVKNNCYLGIPTFVEVGQVESLARILDILTILLAIRG